jgi:hypothetical protein
MMMAYYNMEYKNENNRAERNFQPQLEADSVRLLPTFMKNVPQHFITQALHEYAASQNEQSIQYSGSETRLQTSAEETTHQFPSQ